LQRANLLPRGFPGAPEEAQLPSSAFNLHAAMQTELTKFGFYSVKEVFHGRLVKDNTILNTDMYRGPVIVQTMNFLVEQKLRNNKVMTYLS
jgi:hypothetical protein